MECLGEGTIAATLQCTIVPRSAFPPTRIVVVCLMEGVGNASQCFTSKGSNSLTFLTAPGIMTPSFDFNASHSTHLYLGKAIDSLSHEVAMVEIKKDEFLVRGWSFIFVPKKSWTSSPISSGLNSFILIGLKLQISVSRTCQNWRPKRAQEGFPGQPRGFSALLALSFLWKVLRYIISLCFIQRLPRKVEKQKEKIKSNLIFITYLLIVV